jgi:protein-L-isoaspartate(D-aspartate) O-methyltransferase
VSAASPSIPPALIDQLAEGGRMLIPVGDREMQKLILVRKDGFIVSQEEVFGDVRFVPLLGKFAFKEDV